MKIVMMGRRLRKSTYSMHMKVCGQWYVYKPSITGYQILILTVFHHHQSTDLFYATLYISHITKQTNNTNHLNTSYKPTNSDYDNLCNKFCGGWKTMKQAGAK